MFRVASQGARYRGDISKERVLVLPVGASALVLAVAGGVGGQPGAGEAAQLAIDALREIAPTLVRRRSQAWQRLLRAIDAALVRDTQAGSTTLVVLCLTPKKIVGASVGDSEAWWITAEGHFDLTEAQKRKPYLGSGMASPVPFELKLTQQGTLLLATDGLFKYADPLAITDTVRAGLSEAPEALQRLATGDLALVVAAAGRIAPWIGFLNRFKVG